MGALKTLPAVLLLLAATVVLVLVSFNVPMLKSLYFLRAEFSAGDLKGSSMSLGTLGYCIVSANNETCVGPQVGYSFDLNAMFAINFFQIPSAVSKYLTYTLILHVVGLGFAGLAFIVGLIDMIPGFNMICFPTCLASIGGVVVLIAFIFDLAIFFIAKGAINKVAGSRADVGPALWMTLAAWLLLCFAGCAYGMSRCCCCGDGRDNGGGRRSRRRSNDYDDRNDRPNEMRLRALRDEETRKKESDLPSFQPYERTPLREEDRYLREEDDVVPPLDTRGSVLQGVGVGYGRRNNQQQQELYDPYHGGAAAAYPVQRPASAESRTTAGAAGVGAGGMGVDPPRQRSYDQYDQYGQPVPVGAYNQGQQHYYDNQPQHQQYADQYAPHQGYSDPYARSGQYAQAPGPHDYMTGPASAESGVYHDPGPRVQAAEPYATYGRDDGLSGIGRAATTTQPNEMQYTGQQGFGNPQRVLSPPQASPIHVPTPQHLISPQQNAMLSGEVLNDAPYGAAAAARSPPPEGGGYGQGPYDTGAMYAQNRTSPTSPRPPSYGQVAGPASYRPEKGR